MTIAANDKMPTATLFTMGDEGPQAISTDDMFKGKKVALFGLPGAYTPTCSAKHVPGFMEKADALKAKGIDLIVCVSVNDAFVMGAWGKDLGVGDTIVMAGDGSGELAEKMGLVLDLTERGLGKRSERFSMIVDDGTVTTVNVDYNGAFDASTAEHMLKQL
ncbi:MAG: peroxiredoxin [Rhodospirillaceae bacterium]|jgi:glutaredoxin/glutathione-dependent peroxiredoxin|nr:peroxiredoxin [Rhodospirillaceae bacterium]MBT4220087.1 peroxiredoxin [Rhodospirillaceae bacterium]MBT5013676.1 peroxiredoxin [Rhodospirillaceae bacterium]MBT5309710.1 peroxiredoxin [Rhodospirillaceae bacterium]MBT6406146.1 peroxiredoxin [Rhodospirillaceae bacterium]